MIAFFLTNWRLFAIGAAIIACFGAGWHVRGLSDASKLQSALAAQESVLHKQCDDEKQVTKGANDALQKNLATISAKLAAAKRMHPSLCIRPVTGVAKPAASGGELTRQNGISSDWLRDFAAECETYRSEVITLNDFGTAERAIH